jgi:hypothetical protein
MSNYFPVEDDDEPQLGWLEEVVEMILRAAAQIVCQIKQLLMGR